MNKKISVGMAKSQNQSSKLVRIGVAKYKMCYFQVTYISVA